jgi:replicative DNA helicase
MSKAKDLNDQAVDGTLPDDPAVGATVVSADVARVLTVREIIQSAQQRAFEPRSRVSVCTTGNFEIDKVTGGFKPGFVTVFGADTSWGKSSFLIMVADDNIKAGRRVMIVSAEDSEKIYGDRLLLRRSKVHADNLKQKKLSDSDWKAIVEAVRKAEDVPVYLDARGKPVEWVCKQTKRLIREHKIDVVAYDYLQAFDNEKHQQDRRNQVSYIARVLTDSVKTEDVGGIIFSQITVEKGKPYPDKHSIRESRDVSNAAEVVMLGFTPDKPVTRGGVTLAQAGEKCILVDKCKDGPRGGVFVMPWDDDVACFKTVLDPEVQRFQQIVGDRFDDFGDPQ